MSYAQRLVPPRLRGTFELVLGLAMIPSSLVPIVLYLTKTPEGYLMYLRGRYALAAPTTPGLDRSDRAYATAAFSRLPVDGVPVLVYHGIGRTWDTSPDRRFVVSRTHFAEQMRALQDAGFEAIDSADLARFVRTGDRSALPRRPVLITFDDGRTDAMLQATPILHATNLRATMFVTGKDAGSASIYYAGWSQLGSYAADGVWQLQNQTYGLHRVVDDVKGLQPLSELVRLQPGETLAHYRGPDRGRPRPQRSVRSPHTAAAGRSHSRIRSATGASTRALPGVVAALRRVLHSRVQIAFDQDHQSGWRFAMPGDDLLHVHRLQMRDWTATQFLARLRAAARLSQTAYRERGLDVQVGRTALVSAAVSAPCAPASSAPIAHITTTAKVVAFSFNGGLSPYTPQILDVLARNDAHGTFFVLGRTVPERSRVLARMLTAGDEVANGTWSGSHAAAISADDTRPGAEAHERRGAGRRALPAVPDAAAVQRGHGTRGPRRAQPRHDDGPVVDRPARPVAAQPHGDRPPRPARDRARGDRAPPRRRQRSLGHRAGAAAHPGRPPPAWLPRRHRLGAHHGELAGAVAPRGDEVSACAPCGRHGRPRRARPPAPPHRCGRRAPRRHASLPHSTSVSSRTPHRPSGVVTWRAPRSLPAGAGGYRVFRNSRVVGQTRLAVRRIRVSFRPGRKLRLEVRIALRSGRLSGCGAELALQPPWHAPSAPGDLVAQPGADSTTLTWQPATRGDGALNGYRLFVDGRVTRQVRTTTATLSLSPLHSHTIAVAAVDTQGTESALSNTVSVTPGHTAPTTPGAPTAEGVGPSSIRITWPASTAFGGARVSYRVLRGGKVVAQTAATAYVVGNLAPATGYTFTVLAVDSLGYSSRESTAAQAATMSPAQTTGAVHAFLLASTGASFRDLQAHYQQVGTVYPTYFDCLANGTFVGTDDPLVTAWSRLRGIRVEARFDCQSTLTLHLLLGSPDARAALIGQMVSQANASGWDGINLDFEAGAAADRPFLTQFVTEAGRGPPCGRQDPLRRRVGKGDGTWRTIPARPSTTTTRSPPRPTPSSSCAGAFTGGRRRPAQSTTGAGRHRWPHTSPPGRTAPSTYSASACTASTGRAAAALPIRRHRSNGRTSSRCSPGPAGR